MIFSIELNLAFNTSESGRSLEDHSAEIPVPADVAANLVGRYEGEVCTGP